MIRKATPDDRQRLFQVWKEHLPGGHRVVEIYAWRESDSAASGGNSPHVAEHEGAIAGVINEVGLTLGWGGQRISASWQTDVVVSPAMRGKGVVTQLMQRLTAETAFVLGKGTTAAMHAAKKRFGFRDVPHATFLVCPLTPLYPGGSLGKRVKYAMGYLTGWWHRRPAASGSLRVSAAGEFGPEFDVLAESLGKGDTLTPWKSSAYLNWRYFGCPGRSYRVVRADGPTGLRGAIVLRGPEGVEREAWIVDLVAGPADTATVDALVRAARNELSAKGAAAIWIFATSLRIRARLHRAGFLNTRRTPHFTYFVSGALPFDPAAVEWNFFDGDGDCELYP